MIIIFIVIDDSGDKSKEPTKTVKGNWLLCIVICIWLSNYLSSL